MRKILLAFVFLASALTADMIRVQAGAGVWSAKTSGKADFGARESLDMADAYGLKDSSSNGYFWAFIKHPVPVIPNIRVERTNYSTDGKVATVSGYTAGDKSELVLDQTDVSLYYNILDNTFWLTLDLGLDLKSVDGYLALTDSSGVETKNKVSSTIPLFYTRARIQVPATGLAFEADSKFVSYDGSTISDTRAKIDWSFFESPIVDLGVEAGYRTEKVTLDSSSIDLKTDFTISGAFFGVNGKF